MENELTQKNSMPSVVFGSKQLEKLPRRKINIQKLFHKISVSDYAVMWFLSSNAECADGESRFYLKDLAQTSGISMQVITKMVRMLEEKGLVSWKHDGCGENGTYIQITEAGIQAVTEQQDILKGFRVNVIEQFGDKRFLKLLGEMSVLEEIMNREIEKEDIGNE